MNEMRMYWNVYEKKNCCWGKENEWKIREKVQEREFTSLLKGARRSSRSRNCENTIQK
jgi:hypothetical protein